VADRVWRDLAVDFGRSLLGSRIHVGHCVEIRCDADEFAAADAVDMFFYWHRVDVILGGGLSLTDRDGHDLILRFPSLSRLERAAREAYGNEAAGWVYVRGEIQQDDVNRAHAHRRQPIGLPLEPVHLEQARRKVHPFVFAFHDLYHAIDVAGIHPELLRIGVTLYDSIRTLPPELQGLSFVPLQLHDLTELLHVRRMSLGGFLERAFYPPAEVAKKARYGLLPLERRRDLVNRCRGYVDAVFEEWLPRLAKERRPAVHAYRSTLIRVVDAAR
jgi:hypothetical protein